MTKTFIAGGTGMLGASLVPYLKNKGYDVINQGYKNQADVKIDMTDLDAVIKLLDKVNPALIINLICLSDVEENEKNQELADKLNIKPVKNISHWIRFHSSETKFIQISTDHLYDGEGFNTENKVICRNMYATTKYKAEKIALKANGLVLRTNFFGKSEAKNRQSFTDWIDKSTSECNFPIKLFTDVYFSPLSLRTLTRMIVHTINNFKSGVFNLGSRNGLSKANFVYSYSDFLDNNRAHTREISVDDLESEAVRPKGMMMDVSKFEESFEISLPTLVAEIKAYKKGIVR